MEDRPPFVFLGYRAKRPWEPGPAWAPIQRICCVGEDLCEPPDGWIERWDFNRAFCYGTPEAAWATVPGNRDAYRLFAYFLLPLLLTEGSPPEPKSVDVIFAGGLEDLPGGAAEPPPEIGMVPIGYDVAEHNFGFLGYAYSPLVTNGFSGEFQTNRYGLIDDLDTAIRACETINDRMPEHAPHWVIRVLAKDADAPLPPS